jgi:hypothetical protein
MLPSLRWEGSIAIDFKIHKGEVVKTEHVMYERRVTAESAEDGEYASSDELQLVDAANVREVVEWAVRQYCVRPRALHDIEPWFCTDGTIEDREYFEESIEKSYLLHFPRLSPRALKRIDQMFAIAWREKPRVL